MASNKELVKQAISGLLAFGVAEASLKGLTNLSNSNVNAFGTSLYYPNDLGSQEYPYYISFSFQKYERRSIFNQPFQRDTGMIRLPVPNILVDANQVYYREEDNGLIVGAALENGLRASKNVADIMGSLTSTTAQIAAGVGGGAVGGAVGLAAAVGAGPQGGFRDQLLQIAGVARNPFLTVMFKSPTFKRHRFSWRFDPENKNEVETIKNIILKFKYHQLPDLSGASMGTLLTYPDIVLVGLYPDDTYLYKFKPCVLESVVVNFTPNGQPSYFNQVDAPTSYELTISLLEIEYWLKRDLI